MTDSASATIDFCEQRVEGSAENRENELPQMDVKSDTSDNDKDANVPDGVYNPRAAAAFSADDVVGAAALDVPPPTLASSSDSERVGLELGALTLGDYELVREFKSASIYPEVGKGNMTPSNFQSHWGEGRSNSDALRYHATRPRMRANQTLASQQRQVAASPVVSAANPAVASKPLNLSSPAKELPQQSQTQPVTPAPKSCAVALSASGEDPYEARIESANRRQNGIYNWQSTKSTIKERLEAMLHSDLLADVFFVVGRGTTQQKVPAHKFVLSIGSAVFDAMFNSSFRSDDAEIVLPDVEPASFLALLRFLYTDEVQIGPETVMTTLYTAKKYAVPALEKHCVDFLKHNLSPDNACMLLTQARLFDEPQLAALCLETIDKYTQEALGAEGFTDIDIDTLTSVLDRDSLRIKESKLFGAVLRWAEAECLRQNSPVSSDNKRAVLGNVLAKVRFPLMSVEEFAQGPAQSGILTDKEIVSLFLHFTVNPKPPVAFLDVPRCSMTGKEQTVNRFQQIESRWGYSGTSDKIRFIVDRRIFIVGFGLYGSIHGPFEYQVLIQLIHTGSGRILGSNETTFLSDGTNATFRVMFKEPLEIMPNTNYTASATLKGLDSHYGTKGLRKSCVDSTGGGPGRVTFQFSYAAGNNNGTSVEDGQIPEIIFYT